MALHALAVGVLRIKAAAVKGSRDLKQWHGAVVLVESDVRRRRQIEAAGAGAVVWRGLLRREMSQVPLAEVAAGHARRRGRVTQRKFTVWQVHVGIPVDVIPHAHTIGRAARQYGRPRGRAHRPAAVKAIEDQRVRRLGHCVEVGRLGAAALVSRVAEPQVISQQHDDVGAACLDFILRVRRDREAEPGQQQSDQHQRPRCRHSIALCFAQKTRRACILSGSGRERDDMSCI